MDSGSHCHRYPFNSGTGIDVSAKYEDVRGRLGLVGVCLPRGDPAWLVTRYGEARSVLVDGRFSRAAAQGRNIPRQGESPRDAGMLGLDPPEHSRLRVPVNLAFSKKRMEGLRPRIRDLAGRLLDGVERCTLPVDLVEHYALPLALETICELLGVPVEDRGIFRSWVDTWLRIDPGLKNEFTNSQVELGAYLAILVANRREHPTGDVISSVARYRVDGKLLGELEVVDLCRTLLTAGYESSANQIANFTYALLRHPEWTACGVDGNWGPAVVDELLRLVPLMAGAGTMPRYATAPVEVGETKLEPGAWVVVSLAAANRDPSRFSEPGLFNPLRGGGHLAFGHGPHRCPGAHLTHVELQEALGALWNRFPELRLAEGLIWKQDSIIRGPRVLPVRW